MVDKGMRLIIADDEALIRMGLRAMLEEAGHHVVGAATNGRSAVVMAEIEKPDLILMDIKMLEPTMQLAVMRFKQWKLLRREAKDLGESGRPRSGGKGQADADGARGAERNGSVSEDSQFKSRPTGDDGKDG